LSASEKWRNKGMEDILARLMDGIDKGRFPSSTPSMGNLQDYTNCASALADGTYEPLNIDIWVPHDFSRLLNYLDVGTATPDGLPPLPTGLTEPNPKYWTFLGGAIGTSFTIPNPIDKERLELFYYLASQAFEDDINEGVLEIHERYGQLMLEMVQNNCPVVSGNLRDSFFLTVSFDGVAIDSDCVYYPYIESLYGMVAMAYVFYEPIIMAEIDALITSKVTIS